MSDTSRALIDSPSPVPPNRLVVDSSAWRNSSKTDSSLSEGIPMPVSETANRIPFPFPDGSAVTTMPPVSVNLAALLTRLSRTWRSRVGSPATRSGTSGCRSYWSLRPL